MKVAPEPWVILVVALTSACSSEPEAGMCPAFSRDPYPIQLSSNGSTATMALMSDGTAWCWGDNGFGLCPTEGGVLWAPQRTNLACGTAIHVRDEGGAAVLANGQVAIWSSGISGQYGATLVGASPRSREATVLNALPPVRKMVTGSGSEFALARDGRLFWWGVLDTLATAKDQATQVPGLPPIIDVDAQVNACAVDRDGHVWCWGDNRAGQLGDGTTISRPEPAMVPGIEDAQSIVVGVLESCALLRSGEVWCWGDDLYGQLGQGWPVPGPNETGRYSATPLKVPGLPAIRTVALGYGAGCAIDFDDAVYCWGGTQQLDGLPNGFLPAHRVDWLDRAFQISVGTSSLCAIRPDRSVWCFGYLNENGSNQQRITGYGQLPIPGARP